MTVLYYRDHYLSPVDIDKKKENDLQHYKNAFYDMYTWTTNTGRKVYQINGRIVHSNEFMEVLSREFPKQNKSEKFVLDYKLNVVKDKNGKFSYYCDDRQITKDMYIDLSNKQKTDFLKAFKSRISGLIKKGKGLSKEDLREINSVLQLMLNDYKGVDKKVFNKQPTESELKKSKIFLNSTKDTRNIADYNKYKSVDNLYGNISGMDDLNLPAPPSL